MSNNNTNPEINHEDYDPRKDKRKYVVYRNDIKYKTKNKIDLDRAIFHDKETENDFMNCDTDDIDYRIKQCIIEKYQVLDLAHMDKNAFTKLTKHTEYNKIRNNVIVISANESNLSTLPDLSKFRNLISINLNHNNISTLPFLPDSLEELLIDNNQIEFIKYLPNIKRIKARSNKLKKIEYNDKLRSLFLSNNPHLKHIDPLPNLYYLDISKTGICTIPQCKNLKFLDIDGTNIKTLPILNNLHILSCVRSSLGDISNLTSLYSLVSTDSNVRKLHYMDLMQQFSYNSDHKIQMSSKYKAHHIFKNKTGVIEVIFKENPVPVNILN
jgi:hypothetical protein